jgi:4-amino-4-deoxy-L-arabinose transferase-like glycosyltransferase
MSSADAPAAKVTAPRLHSGVRWLADPGLLLILLLGIALRSQYLGLPMAEAHRWREITNMDIARNFYERSMNLFYPQVSWGGAAQPYVGMEFPLMHWIAALLYLPFGEHAVIGRLISMAFSVGTIWATFAFGTWLIGRATGRAAAFLVAISPSAVFFGRFFISDTPMVCYSVAAVLAWVVYLDTGSRAACVAGTICAALAFLVKIPALMILAPIAWAAWEARRWAAFKDRGLVLGLLLAVAVAGLWYWHADAIYHRTGLSQAIWHPSGNYGPPISYSAGPFVGIYHWSTLARLQYPSFYWELITRTWVLHLTPGGFILALFALLTLWRVPRRRVVDVWIGVVVLFILATSEGNIHHEFHQLPLTPPAALLFGLAAAPAFDGAWLRKTGGRWLGPLGGGLALLVLAQLSFEYSGVVPNFFRPDRLDMVPIEAGRAIEGVVDPSALLVTVEYEEYGNNSPILLYWAHRRGWSFDKTSITPQVIELLRGTYGARYFVTTIWPSLSAGRPDVVQYLETKRRIALPGAPRDTALFDLRGRPDAPDE